MLTAVCVLSLILPFNPRARARQGSGTTYVYDEAGRLHAELSALGEAAVYEYDAAGNFTAVRRLTPNDLEILGFVPRQGPVGTSVTIFGTGFNQGVSSVFFNGSTATIVSVTQASVVALVPPDATTGPITLVTPRGTINSSRPFVVRGVLVTPQAVTLAALDTILFGLSVSGTQTGEVVWSVNGAEGGSAAVGTVTTQGSYTAPNLAGTSAVRFNVRATSVDDPLLFGESNVTVVPFGAGYQFGSGQVSVRYGTPANAPPVYVNGAISVRYGATAVAPPAYVSGAASVRYGTPPNSPPAQIGGAVSASRGPVLTSLTPGSVARGSSVTLTINGVALDGASRVSLFKLADGNPENGITVSNVSVNGQGTALTATLAVASGVAVGRYLVVVTTPAGSTVRADAVFNAIQIN